MARLRQLAGQALAAVGRAVMHQLGRMATEGAQTVRYKVTQGSYELAGALFTGQGYRGDLGLLTSQPTAGVTGGAAYQRTEARLAAQQRAAASQQPAAGVNRGLGL